MRMKKKRSPESKPQYNRNHFNLDDFNKFSNIINIGQCCSCGELITQANFNCTDWGICLDCELAEAGGAANGN